jgi:hypothetical protein
MVLFESSVRTDPLWRRAFFTYWTDIDSNSLICNDLDSSLSPTPSTSSQSTSSEKKENKHGTGVTTYWRDRYHRRARIDRNWLIGRSRRHRLSLPNVLFVCLDSLNHQMITIQRDLTMSLWSRRPSLHDIPITLEVVSDDLLGPTPIHKLMSTSLGSSTSTIHNKYTRSNGEWSYIRSLGSCAFTSNRSIHVIACSMDWKHGHMAVLHYGGRGTQNDHDITITSIVNGSRVATISFASIGRGRWRNTSTEPMLYWLDDGRLIVNAEVGQFAVIWQPLWQRITYEWSPLSPPSSSPSPSSALSFSPSTTTTTTTTAPTHVEYETVKMVPRVDVSLRSVSQWSTREATCVAVDNHDPIAAVHTCVVGLSSGLSSHTHTHTHTHVHHFLTMFSYLT